MAVLVAAMMIVATWAPAMVWAANENITIRQSPSEGTPGNETYKLYRIFDVTKTGADVGDTSTIADHYTEEGTIEGNEAFQTAQESGKLYWKNDDGTFVEATGYSDHGAGTYYRYSGTSGVAYILDSSTTTGAKWYTVLSADNDYVTLEETTVANKYNVRWKKDYSIATAKAFANWLKPYIASNSISEDATMNTATAGVTTASVPMGYYLITSTLGTELILATTDITLNTKNAFPTTTKDAENNSYYMGEYVKYEVTVTVPSSVDTSKTITVHETIPDCLVYSTTEGYLMSAKDKDGNDWTSKVTYVGTLPAGHDATNHENESSMTEFDFSVSLTGLDVSTGNVITITYYAEVRNTAPIKDNITNKERIEYSKYWSNYEEDTIHTFGFNVDKNFENAPSSEITADFFLYPVIVSSDNASGEYYIKDGAYTKVAPSGGVFTGYEMEDDSTPKRFNLTPSSTAIIWKKPTVGTFIYKVKDSTVTDDANMQNYFTAAKSTNAQLQGLKEGLYAIREKSTADGYTLLSSNIIVKISNTGSLSVIEGPAETGAVTAGEKADTLAIDNKTSTVLPATGGMGTTVLYIVGGMLVILAGAYLFFSRKRTA